MEDKDHLKEILGCIDHINEPIDLEAVILKTLQEQERLKNQIARYKANGIKALIVSAVLIVILGILFSLPNSIRSLEYLTIMYTSIVLALLVLFAQLETGGIKLFNNMKNNLL